jgi:hypothetical protein
LYESKGLEFNDVSLIFLHIYLIADKTKVLLYNFFEDSTANPSQWRLVLNGVFDGDDLYDAPTFVKLVMRASAQRYVACGIEISFHPH